MQHVCHGPTPLESGVRVDSLVLLSFARVFSSMNLELIDSDPTFRRQTLELFCEKHPTQYLADKGLGKLIAKLNLLRHLELCQTLAAMLQQLGGRGSLSIFEHHKGFNPLA